MKQAKILIVDDETITRVDLKEMLKENGYDVVGEGRNGEEAVEKAFRLKPDLVIMDMKMPIMDGMKASSIIKGFSDCSILLLTAYSHPELIENAKQADINAYLVKPVRERQLLPAVEIALKQREHFLSLQEKIGSLEKKMAERKRIEKAKGTLMQQFSWSEEEAYRHLRKESMRTNTSLIELAEHILQQTSK